MKILQVFTFGNTLERKVKTGVWEREEAGFAALHQQGVEEIYMLTYSRTDFELAEERKATGQMPAFLHILSYPSWLKGKIGKLMYSFLAPYLHRKIISTLDVVKSNQTNGAWVAAKASRLCKKPYLYRTGYTISKSQIREGNSKWLIRLFSWIEKSSYRSCDAATVTSYGDRDFVIDRYNIDPNKVKVITNFVDTELFSPEPAPDTLITDRIFFLGRLTYAKNLEALITAAAETGWGLELVGAGELEKPLKQLAEELNADVNFVGKVPQVDLPELMRKYRYFILPSHYEGMPKALLEAMACGMCCLGTDASGIREVIKHNQNGILIPGTGAEEIAKEFRKLHEYDAEQLGRAARAFIMESHSMEGLAVKEYGLLSMLVSI